VGSALGPLIAGAAMSVFGAWSLFAWFSLSHGVLAVYAIWRYRVFRRVPTDTPAFQPMLRTTPTAMRLLGAVRGTREA